MKEYNEQVVETLDDAGCIIANKNIIIDNLQARIAELEEENAKLHEAVDLQIPALAFKQLQEQLAAAQEEIQKLRQDLLTSYGESEELSGQLTKAEQRVAESCATYITSGRYMVLNPCESVSAEQHIQRLKNHDIYQAKCLRSGEWRKFLKGE